MTDQFNGAGREIALTYWVHDAYPVRVPTPPDIDDGEGGEDGGSPGPSDIVTETLRWSLYAGAYSSAEIAQLSSRIRVLLDREKLYTLRISERNALRRDIQSVLKAARWPAIDRVVRALVIMTRYQVCQFIGRC